MAEMIEMPKLSDTMTEGTLVKWLKKEGDKVENGDVIAEVETDKATMELEVFSEGVLLKTVVAEGDSVPTGDPVAYIGEEGEEINESAAKSSSDSKDKESKKEDSDSGDKKESDNDADKEKDSAKADASDEGSKPESESESADRKKEEKAEKSKPSSRPRSSSGEGDRVKASPLARKIAEDKGLSLSRIPGSGPGGRIVKKDVLAAAEHGVGGGGGWGVYPDGPIAEEEDLKVSNMRKTIAKRLVQSKQENPHFYVEVEVDAAPLVTLRTSLNKEFSESHGLKFSFNDFVMKAAAAAAGKVPTVNCSWEGDTIRQHGDVHLAFGVALKDGLITPVIREAQNKTLREISDEANELIGKAKDGKLKPEDYTGGTLTVSNLGGPFGVDRFCAIINPPQAAILAVGNIVKKPVVNEKDEVVVGQRMSITISADHRVIDGAVAASYLKALKHFLENPSLLLL